MPRWFHLLTPNKKISFPRRVIFFDTETKEKPLNSETVQAEFRLGVACFVKYSLRGKEIKREWLFFKEIEKFWDFVKSKLQKKRSLILVSHNIDFDLKVLQAFHYLLSLGFKLSKFIIKGQTRILIFKSKAGYIKFLDNLNFFNVPLEFLGESIGLEKLKMPEASASEKEWFKYCQRDVEILVKAWQLLFNFIRKEKIGEFKNTLASLSFSAFRHRFLKSKIYISDFQEAIDLERRSYHGGRTEAFFIGKLPKGKYYLLDVNSMYPFLMAKYKYPTRLIDFRESLSLREFKKIKDKFNYIADCRIKTQENLYPLTIEKRLVFPIGEFWTTLTTNEIKMAFERGHLKEIGKIAIYERDYIFRDFVKYFYKKRREYKEEGNLAFSYFTKILLNSLYGKFGQKNEIWVEGKHLKNYDEGIYEEWNFDRQELDKFLVIGNQTFYFKGYEEAFNSFPAISSEVCANGRLYIYHLIEKAGKENVFYCDTDSLIVNEKGKENLKDLISDKKLGYLKISMESEDVEILGAKWYIFGSEKKLKGIRKDAKKIGEDTFLQNHFQTLKGAIREGNLNSQIIKKVVKKINREYKKGKVLENGKVKPFKIEYPNTNLDVREIDVRDLFDITRSKVSE